MPYKLFVLQPVLRHRFLFTSTHLYLILVELHFKFELSVVENRGMDNMWYFSLAWPTFYFSEGELNSWMSIKACPRGDGNLLLDYKSCSSQAFEFSIGLSSLLLLLLLLLFQIPLLLGSGS
ncbi:hypothetical protein HPP92_010551 [Vanilla planifolia]|uniref:Uncharacterized protein n=1 Tax=Vanilla planifolia TaxID=51239 RepID=A0A835V1Y0_VANPL|nr:hypothetical protein HPP92_010551 [Vanilla planifolia]